MITSFELCCFLEKLDICTAWFERCILFLRKFNNSLLALKPVFFFKNIWNNLAIHVNEIMKSVASIKDQHMDYLVWTMLSFLRKVNNSLIGLNGWYLFVEYLQSVKMCQRGQEEYCINYRSRYKYLLLGLQYVPTRSYGLIGSKHVIFFKKIKWCFTWFEPRCLTLEYS